MQNIELGDFSLERIDQAVEKVRDRLFRTTTVLEQAGVPYAVIGGHAVAAWVSRVDENLVRFTRDVDVLIRRADFERAKAALEAAGFVSRHSGGIEMFLEAAGGKARDAVHVLFADEKVRPEDPHAAPDLDPSERTEDFRFLALDSLVRMKLTSFRDKDRMHLRDFLGAGLVDASWLTRMPDDLAARLKQLIDTPNG